MGEASYVRPMTVAETGGSQIEGYVFSVPGPSGPQRMDVIWYDCPGYYTEIPPVDCAPGVYQTISYVVTQLQVISLYGSTGNLDDASDGTLDGKITLAIGPNPVFVKHGP
jgi:hypothetical protein